MNKPDYDILKRSLSQGNTSPVPQVNTSPVPQVKTSPVPQVKTSPVGQATRNTLRNAIKETHSQTQRERERTSENLLSENQKDFIIAKTKCLEDELERALHIISISKPKPKNIMAYLLTSAFFNGECILEPTTEDEQRSREEQEQEKERARVAAWAQEFTDKMQDSIISALTWFQNLPDDIHQRVETNIVTLRPSLRDQFQGKKPFGPLVLVLLREERNRLKDKGVI